MEMSLPLWVFIAADMKIASDVIVGDAAVPCYHCFWWSAYALAIIDLSHCLDQTIRDAAFFFLPLTIYLLLPL